MPIDRWEMKKEGNQISKNPHRLREKSRLGARLAELMAYDLT